MTLKKKKKIPIYFALRNVNNIWYDYESHHHHLSSFWSLGKFYAEQKWDNA